jgi:transmembrane sensor
MDRPVETRIGEWRDMVLPDGSTAHLGPRTVIRLDFTSEQRVTRLARGEAMFDVVNDPSRPFYVNAGLAGVHATATRFGVSREEQEVLVTVAQGKAAVTQGNPSASSKVEDVSLNAGEQASVTLTGPVEVRKVNLGRELAWVQKRLIFDKQTLAQAVYEFNRRNRVQVEVTDPNVAAQIVDGTFNAADPESFVTTVAGTLHLKVQREGSDRLVLASAAGASGR